MPDLDDRPDVTTTERAVAGDELAAQRRRVPEHASKNILDWLALVLLIVGGLNWGLVGLLDIDMVAQLFGQGTMAARAIEIAIGVAGLWGFALMRLHPSDRYA